MNSICLLWLSTMSLISWEPVGSRADLRLIHGQFDSGSFEEAYALASEAVWNAHPTEDMDHLLRIMDQCRKQAWYVAHGIKLPSRREWADEKGRLSRSESIKYLCHRICLARGPGSNPGTVVPLSILGALSNKPQVDSPKAALDEIIDPFSELLAMNLTKADLEVVYPFFATDWIFRPTGSHPTLCTNCSPAGRHCLCVLVNRACGKQNLIREYDLTDIEWCTPQKIAEPFSNRLRAPEPPRER